MKKLYLKHIIKYMINNKMLNFISKLFSNHSKSKSTTRIEGKIYSTEYRSGYNARWSQSIKDYVP